MDQRLAVHAHIAALFAFGNKACFVFQIVIDTIEHVEPVNAGGGQSLHQPWQHGCTARHKPGAGFLGKIIGPQHKTAQSRRRRASGDVMQMEHCQRCFDHHP